MILQTANGPKEIKVADLDFTNLMCDLEDHDVDVMGLLDDDTRENMKIFKTIRAIIAVLTGTKDLTKAGKILSEHLNWYIANERAMRVGKRLPTYAEFCKSAYGSPQGADGNNTYAWSATSNTARTTCGNVKNAVSATNVRDLVGNVWKWLDEFIHDPTGSTWNWYDVMSGQKVGQLYMANNTGLHALLGGGDWSSGVHDGSRTVACGNYPWVVNAAVGVWCVCDSL